MRKIDFNFSEKIYSFEEIDNYYNETRRSIETRFSKGRNINYYYEFLLWSETQINQLQEQLLSELSMTASFQTLACIESMFRTDFIVRCQLKKRDYLSKEFRVIYKSTRMVYSYRLKEDILEKWKNYKPIYGELIDRIREAFDFRNWYAHGRYWDFEGRTNLRKFNFPSIQSMRDAFLEIIKPQLLLVDGFGDSDYNWKR